MDRHETKLNAVFCALPIKWNDATPSTETHGLIYLQFEILVSEIMWRNFGPMTGRGYPELVIYVGPARAFYPGNGSSGIRNETDRPCSI